MPLLAPIITVDEDPRGFNLISFSSSEIANFSLDRRSPEGELVLLTKTVSPDNGMGFRDFTVASGKQYTYSEFVIDEDGHRSPPSTSKTAILTLSSVHLHRVEKNAVRNCALFGSDEFNDFDIVELFNLEGQKTTETRPANVLRLAAVEQTRIKTAPHTQTIIECPIIIPRRDLAAMKRPFEAMLRSNDLWCFRDPLGTLIFCTLPSQETHTDINLECTIIMWESDYSEHIA
jgi:hypothetical protein